ncbi:MAG TPA: nucleoside-diphosphate sugar epimerase [Pelotomaculum sp.]|nr:nucleoside-diphosphate sugar epimerase [Pelotomaculum sp.]
MRLKGRHILVTGGAGFLGSHLCEKLLWEGARVRVLDKFTTGREDNLHRLKKQVELVNSDMACADSVMNAARDIDTVVHLAFPMVLRLHSIETAIVTEALAGFMNLIKAALERNMLLIYISSIAVYGNQKYVPIDENHPLEPVQVHGAVKLAEEFLCRTLALSDGLAAVILRPADIYGPRNTRLSVPIKFLLQAIRNEPITVYGDGSDSRTYTYVSDFSEAVVLSMILPEAIGGIFNIGGDECVSMCQLACEVKKATGSGSPVVFQDSPAAGRKLIVDSLKAKKILGFKPAVPIADGLAETYRWLKQNQSYLQLLS